MDTEDIRLLEHELIHVRNELSAKAGGYSDVTDAQADDYRKRAREIQAEIKRLKGLLV